MNKHLDLELFQPVRRAFLKGMILAFFVTFAIQIVSLLSSIYMIQVYQRVIPAHSYETLYGLMVIAVLAVIVYGMLNFARSWTFSVLADNLAQSVNLPLLEASVLRSIQGGAAEGANAMRSVADLRSFLTGSAVSLPFDALFAPISLFVLFLIHPIYAIVTASLIGVMVALNIVTDVLTRSTNKDANVAQQRHLQEVANSLRHSEAIEAMGMLPALVRSWGRSHAEMLGYSNIASSRMRLMVAVSKSIDASKQYIIISTGAFLVLSQQVSASVLFSAMILTGLAVGPFSRLVENWRQWTNAFEAWGRVKSVIISADSARQTMPAPAGSGPLVVENLVYLPPGRQIPVLRGLNFVVAPGEVLGIVGPSGAGKSTLARCLTGIIKPTAGGVYLDGQSTYLWERGSFGRVTGYLPQSLSMIDGTIRQTIARMQENDPRDVIKAAQAAGIHDLIGKLPHGYDTPVLEGMHVLSGGQAQRLALARALYGDPKFLILDEPNSNLDHQGEMALVKAIQDAKARGAIVILIAHRPSVMEVADQILVLENGSVAKYGPTREILGALSGVDAKAAEGRRIPRLRVLTDGKEG